MICCCFALLGTERKNKQWARKHAIKFDACSPTCRISSICVTEGGTRARGRDRASSNFTLRTMVFLKWSRASCRTEGSLPCTHRGHTKQQNWAEQWSSSSQDWIVVDPLGSKDRKKQQEGCAPEQDGRWPAASREHHRRRSPRSLPESRVTSDLHQSHRNKPEMQLIKA